MELRRVASYLFKKPPLYSFELTIRKPAGWPWLTPTEIYDKEKRAIWSGLRLNSGRSVGLKASENKGKLACEIFASSKLTSDERADLRQKLERALGVREDIAGFYKMARRDKVLRKIIRKLWGMREGYWNDLFSALCLAVLLQMAPVKRSMDMMAALLKHYGERLRFDGKTIVLWPRAERIAKAGVAELKRKCNMGYRAKNLKKIAQQIVSGFPTLEELEKLPPQAAKEKLMELYGVGEYSAEMVSVHTSFPLDVWSVQIFAKLLGVKIPSDRDPREYIERVKALAEKRWGKYKGIALVYVLNALPELGLA